MAKMTLDELVAQLAAVFGAGLRAVVLFGSAAAGEHIAKRSDTNVLVLVDALDLPLLEREAAVSRAWAEAGHPPPLTMTVDEWRGASDVFPMEYADILERHRVLHGTPPFDGITVDRGDLRLQLEHQARGKLLRLRQGLLSAGGDRGRLLALLADSLSTFMIIFRGLVRFHGEVPSTDYEALTRQAVSLTGLAPEPFTRVIRHVRGAERIAPADVMGVLAGYLDGVERLVSHLDRAGET